MDGLLWQDHRIGDVLKALPCDSAQGESYSSVMPAESVWFNVDDHLGEAVQRIPDNQQQFSVWNESSFVGTITTNHILKFIGGIAGQAALKRGDISPLTTQFVSHVAHDLRNPLSVVLSSCSLLRKIKDDRPETTRCIELIERSSKQLVYLSNGLIDFDRYSFASVLMCEAVEIDVFIQNVIGSYSDMVACRGQVLEQRSAAPFSAVFDPYIMMRAIGNMIDRVSRVAVAKNRIWIEVVNLGLNDAPLLYFIVADEDYCGAKISSLMRSDHGLVNDQEALGMGLGMTITRRFAALHGGSIRLHQDRSGSSALVLWIPQPSA